MLMTLPTPWRSIIEIGFAAAEHGGDFNRMVQLNNEKRIIRGIEAEVTGLVVNDVVNLPRNRRRWLRSSNIA